MNILVMGNLAKTNAAIDERINKRGELLPDDEMFSLLTTHLEKENPSRENLLLEGYPRSIKQYEMLKEWLAEKSVEIDSVIFLEISEKEILKRTSSRRVDKESGKIYNLVTNPPGSEIDINNLYQRPDDKPEAIKKRLGWFKESVLPLIEVFEKEGVLEKIDGERPIKVITEDILTKLERINKTNE